MILTAFEFKFETINYLRSRSRPYSPYSPYSHLPEYDQYQRFPTQPRSVALFWPNLHRPESIIATKDGTLWVSDSQAAVTRIDPDGTQTAIGLMGAERQVLQAISRWHEGGTPE